MVIESHSGKLGSAVLHTCCAEPSLSRYRQVVEWHGTIGNLERIKALHRKLAALNRSSYGSVSLLIVLRSAHHIRIDIRKFRMSSAYTMPAADFGARKRNAGRLRIPMPM